MNTVLSLSLDCPFVIAFNVYFTMLFILMNRITLNVVKFSTILEIFCASQIRYFVDKIRYLVIEHKILCFTTQNIPSKFTLDEISLIRFDLIFYVYATCSNIS